MIYKKGLSLLSNGIIPYQEIVRTKWLGNLNLKLELKYRVEFIKSSQTSVKSDLEFNCPHLIAAFTGIAVFNDKIGVLKVSVHSRFEF